MRRRINYAVDVAKAEFNRNAHDMHERMTIELTYEDIAVIGRALDTAAGVLEVTWPTASGAVDVMLLAVEVDHYRRVQQHLAGLLDERRTAVRREKKLLEDERRAAERSERKKR